MNINNQNSLKNNYKNLPLLIKIYCCQEEFNQKTKSHKSNEQKINLVVLIQKDLMKRIKDIFDYKNLYQVFKQNNIIEHIKENDTIKYDNLNENILVNIINILKKYKKDLVDKIENINFEEKINKFNIDKWNYKKIKLKKRKVKISRLLKIKQNI